MKRNKTEIAKTIVGFVVGAGVSRIARTIIHQNHHDEERLHNRVMVESASIVIGMMAAEASKNYTDAKIDELVSWWEINIQPRIR